MESKISKRLSEAVAAEVCEHIYAPRLEREFTTGFSYLTDINQAHVLMLRKCGLLKPDAAGALAAALSRMEREGPSVVELDPRREDAYFNYEAHLISLVGKDIGGRMHIARSRNDISAAMDRMRARDIVLDIVDALLSARATALDRAAAYSRVVMPGYTHLQPAQPITFGYYILGIAQALERDAQRLEQSYARINLNPLGAGALAGTTFPIDRMETTRLLGFAGLVDHSLDAVASRDFALEVLASLSLLSLTWTRLAQDFFVMTTHEFQTIEFPDRVAGTSSIMPQKKNPVVLEHLKGRAGQMVGTLVSAMMAVKATNFTNTIDGNREALRGFWDSAEETRRCLALVDLILSSAKPNEAVMLRRVQENFASATDLADTLVRDADLSFREAHHIVGGVVRAAMDRGMAANEITSGMVDDAARREVGRPLGLPEDLVKRSLDVVASVEGRTARGGPAASTVMQLIAEARSRLAADTAANQKRRAALAEARAALKREVARLAA